VLLPAPVLLFCIAKHFGMTNTKKTLCVDKFVKDLQQILDRQTDGQALSALKASFSQLIFIYEPQARSFITGKTF
jgi:hypothetical protein